ncbi:MAG: ABC transporter permease, partial [Chloroflexota bacterium]|nr:ABC transporter permease [Chloroflexota bacterium]
VGLIALLALPSLVPLEPNRVDLDAVLLPPSRAHPLGTDENGRDALARLLVGARATLGIGVAATLVAVTLGTLLGALAGYYGGAVDAVLMRAVDFALAFPSLFAILLFTSFITAGPVQLVLLIGLTGWMPVARLVRGNVRELINAPYVEAAHAVGASGGRVILRHLLPNTGGVLFVATLVQLNRSILAEATISFLGLGIQPPAPTWGNLLIGAQDFLYTAPWLAIAPGLAITLALLTIYRLGMDRTGGTG